MNKPPCGAGNIRLQGTQPNRRYNVPVKPKPVKRIKAPIPTEAQRRIAWLEEQVEALTQLISGLVRTSATDADTRHVIESSKADSYRVLNDLLHEIAKHLTKTRKVKGDPSKIDFEEIADKIKSAFPGAKVHVANATDAEGIQGMIRSMLNGDDDNGDELEVENIDPDTGHAVIEPFPGTSEEYATALQEWTEAQIARHTEAQARGHYARLIDLVVASLAFDREQPGSGNVIPLLLFLSGGSLEDYTRFEVDQDPYALPDLRPGLFLLNYLMMSGRKLRFEFFEAFYRGETGRIVERDRMTAKDKTVLLTPKASTLRAVDDAPEREDS